MVIDLTNTNKFYDEKAVFEAKRVQHRAIFCPGKGKIPSIERVQRFQKYVDEYVKQTEGIKDRFNQEYLIGVMSKHGNNRPGYFICTYLITKKDWSADDAIAAFEKARGSIERDKLLASLYDIEESTAKNSVFGTQRRPETTATCYEAKRKNWKAGAASNNRPKQLPAKWKRYENIGDVIATTRFIIFKSPLDSLFFKHVPQEHWFTPELLVQEHMPSVQRTLGLVVDVTNSKDFYQPDVFKSAGIQHHKILCLPITDKVPQTEKVELFCQYVDTWIAETAGQVDHYNQPPLIGVHSTRGVNRAAYFVCRYMIERGGWEPNTAIEAVESARGEIEKDTISKFLRTLKPGKGSALQDASPFNRKYRQPLNAPTRHRLPNQSTSSSSSTEHESEQFYPYSTAAGEKTYPPGKTSETCKQQ